MEKLDDLLEHSESPSKKRKADFDIASFYSDPSQPTKRAKKTDCPYLSTIKRHLLDFDFEKLCSASLSNLNVYACLCCGKYYQGKGKHSHAYTHALDAQHHVFINLASERVFVLPDDYEVVDASLNDIKYNLRPQFAPAQIALLDAVPLKARSLVGEEYLPGFVGLNNLQGTDFVNVVVHVLSKCAPVRNAMMQFSAKEETKTDPERLLAIRFAELTRKVWNPKNFKGQVSPHELMQAVALASNKRFRIGVQSDPVHFFAWLVNAFGRADASLKGVLEDSLQGRVQVTTLKPTQKDATTALDKMRAMRSNAATDVQFEMSEHEHGFYMLTLDIPPTPLFKDKSEKVTIPQLPLGALLKKIDGKSFSEEPGTCVRRKIKVMRMPQLLVLHVRRFTKNKFFTEKNNTIVNFPLKNLDMSAYLHSEEGEPDARVKYDLLANIIHDGKANEGSYRVQVRYKPDDEWYELQDLHVTPLLQQQVALSESYILVFERQQQ